MGIHSNDSCKNAFNKLDFSVIIATRLENPNRVFRLRRYNGLSHIHSNKLESQTFFDYHIHSATERYQKLGLHEESYATPTDRYENFEGAIGCALSDTNFVFPAGIRSHYESTLHMDIALVEKSFQDKFSKDIRVQQQGINRFLVFTPFTFDDGDHFVIVLRWNGDRAVLTDEAHTYMHLSYWLDEQDLLMSRFESVIENTLSYDGVQEIDEELILEVPDHQY